MPKEEWGVKRVCPNCSTRFYDLRRDPMTCPSCGHSISLSSLTSGKGRTLVADKSDATNKTSDEAELETGDEVLDDDDTEVDLGDDVLEDDDDDEVSLDDIADVAADDDDS
ncbi:TIGR02300 family protein [Actibacterium sp. D379-3]